MNARRRFAALGVAALALGACNGQSPTAPQTPPPQQLPPAQLTFNVVFQQATASAADFFVVEHQLRSSSGTIFVRNEPGTMTGHLLTYDVSAEMGQPPIVLFNESTVLPDGGLAIPPGQEVPLPFEFDWRLDDPQFFPPGNNPPMHHGWTMGWDDGFGNPMTSTFDGSVGSGVTRLPPAPCIEDPFTLCLQDDRFQVQAEFPDADGVTQRAPVEARFPPLGGRFSIDGLPFGVDIGNDCVFKDRYWVLVNSTLDREHTVIVTDLQNSIIRMYQALVGAPGPSLDDNAFRC